MNQIGVIEFECDRRLFIFTIENDPDCDKIQTNYNHVISLNSKELRHNPDLLKTKKRFYIDHKQMKIV